MLAASAQKQVEKIVEERKRAGIKEGFFLVKEVMQRVCDMWEMDGCECAGGGFVVKKKKKLILQQHASRVVARRVEGKPERGRERKKRLCWMKSSQKESRCPK